MQSVPVVFIHGLWVHGSAWAGWLDLFAQAGYQPLAPGWPGDADTVSRTRANPDAVANKGIDDIVDSYAKVIAGLPARPVVIGHSFGGLIAQRLLAEGTAAAAIAIDPGQIKGVKPVPFAQVRSGLPVLRNPGNKKRATMPTEKQFHYAFGNALSREESDQLHGQWVIPGPGRPLFEATAANFKADSPAAVDTKRADRGPLLFVAGGQDHTVPEVVVRAAYKLYGDGPNKPTLKVFEDRGHSLVFDHGWREIADYCLAWLGRQQL